MYTDAKPCAVCGSEVRLEPHTPDAGDETGTHQRFSADPTLDDRVCTNPNCPSHAPGPDAPAP